RKPDSKPPAWLKKENNGRLPSTFTTISPPLCLPPAKPSSAKSIASTTNRVAKSSDQRHEGLESRLQPAGALELIARMNIPCAWPAEAVSMQLAFHLGWF